MFEFASFIIMGNEKKITRNKKGLHKVLFRNMAFHCWETEPRPGRCPTTALYSQPWKCDFYFDKSAVRMIEPRVLHSTTELHSQTKCDF